jgi:hypothetical protein
VILKDLHVAMKSYAGWGAQCAQRLAKIAEAELPDRDRWTPLSNTVESPECHLGMSLMSVSLFTIFVQRTMFSGLTKTPLKAVLLDIRAVFVILVVNWKSVNAAIVFRSAEGSGPLHLMFACAINVLAYL